MAQDIFPKSGVISRVNKPAVEAEKRSSSTPLFALSAEIVEYYRALLHF
jgi:hypothetical protein